MDLSELSKCPVFGEEFINDGFSSLEGIKFKTKLYNKGEVIAHQGDICKGLYLLTKGSVKTEMINENGGILSIEKIQAVRPLAPAFIFAEINTFPVDVTALEISEVMFITKEEILELFQKEQKLFERYIQYNSNMTQFLSNKLQMLTIKTIKGKLSHYILDLLAKEQSKDPKCTKIKMDKNQTELARLFGVTRPSLARTLSDMEKEDLISINKKEITITDYKGLKEARG